MFLDCDLSTSSRKLFEAPTWSMEVVRPKTFWDFQSSFVLFWCDWPNVSTYTTWKHLLLYPEGFRLVGITWGKGCFTISNICKVWLMSEWVNPPWHHWMCSAAFHLSAEVTPRSPYCLTVTFLFASSLFPSDLVCWLHSCSLIAFASQPHKPDFRGTEPLSPSWFECHFGSKTW